MVPQSGFGLYLKKVDNVLGKTVQILCVALLAIIVLTISISITTRFVFFNPLNFADALAKYLMIWMCFLGSGLAIRAGEHIVVEMFRDSLTEKGRKKLIVFIDIVVSVFLIIVIYNGFIFAFSGLGSHDPFVFGISMIIPYLSVPIGFIYMLIQLNITTALSLLSKE
ncbi:hypothetical protein CIL03_12870 [Virgibacillus indicus]|uniref:Tripartite ATP-independent periplasmic transporters DctQ component domain-containing protein n=1 Tax=Virgibacillus indicus TaxID=2024554 RepID=A0A265N977_9BACI|nr:TRAP transporter small permease [Virgibacillus indicus]OZU88024.1 hypothetical protein CIL03_12870 [Virgibacillus indicus]